MKPLAEQLRSYHAYHRHPVNAAAHFLGVPLVILGLFVPLGWARLAPGWPPATPAAALVAAVLGYYLLLDWRMAAVAAPFGLAMLWEADEVSRWPRRESLRAAAGLFLAAEFVFSWGYRRGLRAAAGMGPARADRPAGPDPGAAAWPPPASAAPPPGGRPGSPEGVGRAVE